MQNLGIKRDCTKGHPLPRSCNQAQVRLASDTQQKPTSSKLPLHRRLTQFFLRQDTSLGVTVGQMFVSGE